MNRLSAWLKRDGWILAALLGCLLLYLLIGTQETSASTEEGRISRVLSTIEGAGRVELAVCYENALPCGAVIVADGAGDMAVQLRLVSAVRTLLGLTADRISVYEREGH